MMHDGRLGYEGRVATQTFTIPGDASPDPKELLAEVLNSQGPFCPFCKAGAPAKTLHTESVPNGSKDTADIAAIVVCRVCSKHFFAFACSVPANGYSLAKALSTLSVKFYPPVEGIETEKSLFWRHWDIDEQIVFLYEHVCLSLDAGAYAAGVAGMRPILEALCLILTGKNTSKREGLSDLMKQAGLDNEEAAELLRKCGNDLLHNNEEAQKISINEAQRLLCIVENLIDSQLLIPKQMQDNASCIKAKLQ